ncbi:DNA topoisomerase 3 [Sedimentibacter hydroxybenzoicus DSM 7310]|uniref:DNA topoisomerase n=1 Tax=Sedimentibacter hydroxybenzoicus DSM 7310 TaxID=1123245 RepID=A0A974BI03_SEDHY|nr:DNA topoisomerase 3 [Sedimentibacter hydroxybenzoicus]NYB73226.1 DNA topoisomerase 3 [Sedimentibacter hydroxybenzoicus DSM 7310]
MKLIVTEKPSVAKDIAGVLNIKQSRDGYIQGEEYIITWCVGHLIQLSYPEEYDSRYKAWNINDLPIFPKQFKYSVNESTKKQYEIVKSLMNRDDVDELICATDAGREGQLIFGYVYVNAGCTKPVKRLWISSMTDEAIAEGFNNLKDNKEYFPLYQSARARSEADWLVGINATRLFTVKYNRMLTIGRVQTPTLSLIVARQKEIDNFVSQPFYEVAADCEMFTATWFNKKVTRIDDLEKAEAIAERCRGKEGTITKLNTKRATTERPLLYDLTELQRDGNKRYGYSAEQTLDAAQNLYEKYKLATYPRTDSRYLTKDMKPKLAVLLQNIKDGWKDSEDAKYCVDKIIKQKINADKRVIDDSKVTDHHAIIVTPNIRNVYNIKLPEREANILRLIVARFIAVLDRKQEYDQTDIELNIDKEKFKARGKKIVIPGWKEVEDIMLGKVKEESEDGEININLMEGDKITPKEIKVLTKKTSPPKPYTEATLLTAMETAGKQIEDEKLREEMKSIGLGTPATRAGIIEKLISVGYIKRNKKNLIPTQNGIQLIEIVHDKLKKPDLTGEWESELGKIAKKESSSKDFIVDIKKYVAEIINEGKISSTKNVSFEQTGKKSKREIIGTCPRCGREIFESKKSFFCAGYRNFPSCRFSLWKEDKLLSERGVTLTKEIAASLLKNKQAEVTIKINEKEQNITIGMKDNGYKTEYVFAEKG